MVPINLNLVLITTGTPETKNIFLIFFVKNGVGPNVFLNSFSEFIVAPTYILG